MKRLRTPFLTAALICVFLLNISWEDPVSNGNGTVEEQFDYVLKKANKYKEGNDVYRVIPDDLLTQLVSNVDKRIGELKSGLEEASGTIQTQESEITSLKTELQATNDKLDKANKEKNSMNFLGVLPVNKSVYRIIMWAIIAASLLLAAVSFLAFARSNAATRQTKAVLERTREEFEAFRKKSMEEDLILRRKLQTEINKNL